MVSAGHSRHREGVAEYRGEKREQKTSRYLRKGKGVSGVSSNEI